MPMVSVILSDSTLEAIDKEVNKRNVENAKVIRTGVTAQQRHEALQIAQTQGQVAANAFLREVNTGPKRVYRVGLISEYIERCLKEDQAKK